MDDVDEVTTGGGLSDPFSDEVAAYRSLSTLAVISCLLGGASQLGFFTSWLAGVAYVGLAVGVVALRSIQADPSTRAGLGFAIAGVALSCCALTGGLVRQAYGEWRHRAAILPVANGFIEALAKDESAFASELMLPWAQRQTPEKATDFYREDEDAAARLKDLLAQPEVAVLRSKTRLVEGPTIASGRGGIVAVCVYSAETSPRAVVLKLHRSGESQPDAPAAWRITAVEWAKNPS